MEYNNIGGNRPYSAIPDPTRLYENPKGPPPSHSIASLMTPSRCWDQYEVIAGKSSYGYKQMSSNVNTSDYDVASPTLSEAIPPIRYNEPPTQFLINVTYIHPHSAQPPVSDLSLNPFQDDSECRFLRKPHDFTDIGHSKGDVHGVYSFSPGSPVDSGWDSTIGTNPGPVSSSSVGESSGYQSLDESTLSCPKSSHILLDLPSPVDVCTPEASDSPGPSPTSLPPLPSKTIPQQMAPKQVNALDVPVEEVPVKKPRIKYTAEQLDVLEKAFKDTPYPDWDEMDELTKKLDIAEQKIKVWFQNKRARWRKKQTAAQKQQTTAAILQNQQMSALYKFPAPGSAFIPSSEIPSRAFQHMSGKSPNVQLSYPRPQFSEATHQPGSVPVQRHEIQLNCQYQQPAMIHHTGSANSQIPGSSNGGYGHVTNPYVYM